MHTFNPSIWGATAGGYEFETSLHSEVQANQGYIETLSQKQNTEFLTGWGRMEPVAALKSEELVSWAVTMVRLIPFPDAYPAHPCCSGVGIH